MSSGDPSLARRQNPRTLNHMSPSSSPDGDPRTPGDRLARLASTPEVWFAAALAVALWTTYNALAKAGGSVEIDFARDSGAAQSLLDGGWFSDPVLLGETRWYNPLVPGIVAVIAYFTKIWPQTIYLKGGVFLGLLVPIPYYALAARLFDRWVALASGIAFLFLSTWSLPSYMSATYSPWLWPANFVQLLFYTSMLAYLGSLRSPSWRNDVLTGVALGFTFLGHTAPYLLSCGVVLSCSLGQILRERSLKATRDVLLRGITIAAVSLVVSAPFWLPLLSQYRFQVRDWANGEFRLELLERGNFASLMRAMFGPRMVVAVAGLVALVVGRVRARGKGDPWPAWMLLSCLVLAASAIAYDYVAQAHKWHVVVPSFHYLIYVRAVEGILFGLGAATIARGVSRLRWLQSKAWPSERVWPVVLCLGLLAIGAWGHSKLKGSVDLGEMVEASKPEPAVTQLQRWVLDHTAPSDVFYVYGRDDKKTRFSMFRSRGDGYGFLSPTARKLVVAPSFFSNPYVKYEVFTAKDRQLRAALHAHDEAAFKELAAQHGVRYVLYTDLPRNREAPETLLQGFLKRVFPVEEPTWGDGAPVVYEIIK